jgi:AmmeMemoRadiSam system protein A
MQQRAGVFVSIHKKNGELRGCIGTFQPTTANVAEEIIQNAVSAATNDPRFDEIREDELDDLEISVDVLSPPEPVDSLKELDPKRYGVIVQSGWRRGLLLPDLEGVDSVQQQVEIAMRKAGIRPGEPITLYRFEVKRYH